MPSFSELELQCDNQLGEVGDNLGHADYQCKIVIGGLQEICKHLRGWAESLRLVCISGWVL